jgi:hypothetical protein
MRSIHDLETDRLLLASGHDVRVDPARPDRLEIRSPRGDVELAVRFTAAGPVLSFRAADVELAATRAITMRCATFEVAASEHLSLASDGDARLVARQTLEAIGADVSVSAIDGNARIDAADDVDIHGKLVLLNC